MDFLQNKTLELPKNKTSEKKKDFIAVLGAKGSGKTLFITALLSSIVDGMVDDMTGTVSETTHEFLNRHLLPMRQNHQWPEPTRGWHDLTLSLRWELDDNKISDYQLLFQDIQGSDFETCSADLINKLQEANAYFFIVSPKHLLTEEELRNAAGENAYLESIIPEEGRFARQINWNYSQALEKIIATNHLQREIEGQKTSRPISVIFTRKDDYPHLEIETLKKKFVGTFRWFQAHARYVEYFFVSSVGKTIPPDPQQDQKNKQVFVAQYGDSLDLSLPAKNNPPPEISPEGVVDTLRFVTTAFTQEKARKIRESVRRTAIITSTVFSVFLILWLVSWSYNSYLAKQMREENAHLLNEYIAENPQQIIDIYKKVKNYLNTYGENHHQGKKFLAIKQRLTNQVQDQWFTKISSIARENDREGLSVGDYRESCVAIESYLKSEFPEGKQYLREIYERIKKRKALAQTWEMVKNSESHGDYHHALTLLDEYLKAHNFRRSMVAEKRKSIQKTLSSVLYSQAMKHHGIHASAEKLEERIVFLEDFINREKLYLAKNDLQKIRAEVWELKSQQANLISKKAFQQRNYRQAYQVLKDFVRLEKLPVPIRKMSQLELQQLYHQEYEQELAICLKQGENKLDALAKFQDKYAHHQAYDKSALLNKVSVALAEVARETEQTSNWEQGIAIFEREEQRFIELVHETSYWKFFLPLLQGRIFKLADLGDYEGAWSQLKAYKMKLSGQVKLKKYLAQLQLWSKKLATTELENKWKTILLLNKPETAINALEKFKIYQNQSFFSEIYRNNYRSKVSEKRFQLCLEQYEANLSKKDFAQARLILAQYEQWGPDSYSAKAKDMKESVNKQEILNFWNACLTKVDDSFLGTAQKLEAVYEFQRLHRERPGYKYIEEDVEILAKTMTDNLKEERRHQVNGQISKAFEDEAALSQAQESFEKYQKLYPADTEISRFQAQIHQVKVSWATRHFQNCGDIFDAAKKYEAYEQFLRKYSSNRYLYRNLLQKAEKAKKESAQEWDRREFQKADSTWRIFRQRADEFSMEDGRKRLEEMSKLYEQYTKHWGPEKNFVTEAREQILFLRQLRNGGKYTIKLNWGKFAKNYWVYNPTVEVTIQVGNIIYPYKVHNDKQKITWNEEKEFFWKAYEPVQLTVKDSDKKKKNKLITHNETGFLSLIQFCTVEDSQQFDPTRMISNKNNEIHFELVSSNVPQINKWFGIKGDTDDNE